MPRKNRLSEDETTQLAALSSKQLEQSLPRQEKGFLERLVEQYDRAVLLRAEAARLLKARGHDVSVLLAA